MIQSTLNNSIQIPLLVQNYEDKINNYILNITRRKGLKRLNLRITTKVGKKYI